MIRNIPEATSNMGLPRAGWRLCPSPFREWMIITWGGKANLQMDANYFNCSKTD